MIFQLKIKRLWVTSNCGEITLHFGNIYLWGNRTGRANWTLKLLANKMVELQYVETISPSTVGRVLKKMN